MTIVKIVYKGGKLVMGELALVVDQAEQVVGTLIVNTGSQGPYIAACRGDKIVRTVLKKGDAKKITVPTIVAMLDDLMSKLDFSLSEEWKRANLERVANR